MIYFILNIENNTIKIGTTAQLNNRLTTLQTATAEKLVILHTTTKYAEKDLHKLFADKNVSGEWFTFDKELKHWLNCEKINELNNTININENTKNKTEPIEIDDVVTLTLFLLKNNKVYKKYLRHFKVKSSNYLYIVINDKYYRVAGEEDLIKLQNNLMLYENVEINDKNILKIGLTNYLDIKNKTLSKNMVEIPYKEWFQRTHNLIEINRNCGIYREHEFI